MTSVIVPPVDLAPGMPSRVVTISATDVTEGGQSLAGQMVRFALSDTLDVTSGGDVIAKTQAEVVLDSNGEGRIRLPVYTDAVKTWCGDPDWAILVTATWGSQKAIRVPAGTSSIALSSLPPVRPLRGREKQWAITGASVTVAGGPTLGAVVTLAGGLLHFEFTIPGMPDQMEQIISRVIPTTLVSSSVWQELPAGPYNVVSASAAEAIGMPAPSDSGVLRIEDGYTSSTQGVIGRIAIWDPFDGSGNRWVATKSRGGDWSDWTTGTSAGPRLALSTDRYQDLSSGWWRVVSAFAAEAMGLPSPDKSGLLHIVDGCNSPTLGQYRRVEWRPFDGTGQTWTRVRVAGEWSPRFTTGTPSGPGVILSSTDMAALPDGCWTLVSTTASSAHGFPGGHRGDMIQSRGYDGQTATRRFYPFEAPTEQWVQTWDGDGWGPWQQAGGVSASVERETRVAEFRARHAGTFGTGGKAVLSLVFDHGTDNFIAKVLPLLRKYGVPATIGLNSQMYSPDYQFYGTDQNTTWAGLQDEFINAGVSVWNHGRLHKPVSEDPLVEIIGGRDELAESLPKLPIDGWLHTGAYGDFASGDTFAKYRDHSVGALILNGHAVATGDIQEPIKPLSGEMKPGFDGQWIDGGAAQLATVKSMVQRAQTVGGAVMTRQHPQYIDEPDRITTAQLDDFIGWAAAERDAGRLIIATGDMLNIMDASHEHRPSLIGEATTGTASFLASDHPLRRGGVCVLEADLDGTGTVELTVTGAGIDARRTITAASGTVTLPFTLPLDAAGTISVQASGVAVSAMRVVAGAAGAGRPPAQPHDSGVVNATSLLSGFTSSTSNMTLQRIGPHVEYSVRARQFDKAGANSGSVLCTLPLGYRPASLYRGVLVAPTGVQVDVDPSGAVTLTAGTIPQNAYVTFRLSHLTTDQPPA